MGVSVIDPCATKSISTIDVSSFDNRSLIIVTGAAQSHTLTSTTSGGHTCSINYQLKVTGPNSSLITVSGNTITFTASSVLVDTGTYYVAVTAKTTTQTDLFNRTVAWSSATIGTFYYVNPCLTATMPTSITCPAAFSVVVGAS